MQQQIMHCCWSNLKQSLTLHDCLHKLRGRLSTIILALTMHHALASLKLGKQACKQTHKHQEDGQYSSFSFRSIPSSQ